MTTTQQPACEIWFIRHGETDWNAAHRMQGRTDIALNAFGIAQANALLPMLNKAHALRPFTAAYATPLQRAQQTAAPLCAATGLPLGIVADLQERAFGMIEGEAYTTVSEGIGRTPEITAAAQGLHRRDPDYLPPKGDAPHTETLRQFYTRTTQAAQALAALHAGERIFAVSHGGVLDCIWRWANAVPLETQRTWRIVNASVNIVRIQGDSASVAAWGLHAESAHPALDEDAL